MIEKLNGIEERYAELERRLSDPAIVANNREYAQLAKERAQLEQVAVAIREYRRLLGQVLKFGCPLCEGGEGVFQNLKIRISKPLPYRVFQNYASSAPIFQKAFF